MAQFYEILKADPLGEPWTPNAPDAKPIQNYWCQVKEEDLPVSIGKQVGNTVSPGDHVYGDLMKATSQKGTQYWKFKSQRVPDDVKRPANSPAQAAAQASLGDDMPAWFVPVYNMLEYIYKEFQKMNGEETAELKEPEADKPEQIAGNEPLDPETKAQLDDIFGADPVPEEK